MGNKKRSKKRAVVDPIATTATAATEPIAVDAATLDRAAAMQMEELEVLQAIFDADLTTHSATPLYAHIFSIRVPCEAPNDARLTAELVLTFDLTRAYPISQPPNIDVTVQHGLSDSDKAALQSELECVARDKLGDAMVYDLVMHASEFVAEHLKDQSSFFEQMVQRQQDIETEEKREEEQQMQLEQKEAEAAGQELWKRIDEERRKHERMQKTRRHRRRHDASFDGDGTSGSAGTGTWTNERPSFGDENDLDDDDEGSESATTAEDERPRRVRKLTSADTDDVIVSDSESSLDEAIGMMDRPYSRYSADFKEIGQLGRGGGGTVVKARNRLDRQFYAVKKVKLDPDDPAMKKKILREVKTISRMQHRNIVRYFQAWIEGDSGAISDGEDDESDDESGESDDERSAWEHEDGSNEDAGSGDAFLDDDEEDDWLGTLSNSVHRWSSKNNSRRRSSSARCALRLSSTREEDGFVWERDDGNDGFEVSEEGSGATRASRKKKQSEMLYIQMEFCASNSLREVIDEGELHKNPDQIWTWFRQIVEAIAYIHGQGIIHRDIKPPNIFLDGEGAVKLGDFGLAVQPSKHELSDDDEAAPDENAPAFAHLTLSATSSAAEAYNKLRLENLESTRMAMRRQELTSVTTASFDVGDNITVGVGTAFYRAPEQEQQGQRYNHKADMFSLGIVLFEMWSPPFTTLMERAQALTNLRERSELPATFAGQDNVKEIIIWLCNPVAASRPSAAELLASPQLPAKIEVEESYLREALQTLANPQGKFFPQLIDALLTQEPLSHLDYIYDHTETLKMRTYVAELKTWSLVQNAMQRVFERHGAVAHETPLLMPRAPARVNANGILSANIPQSACALIDGGGVSVALPFDLTERTARFVARHSISRLKCFQFDRVYRKSTTGAHPRELTEADFNVIWDDRGSTLSFLELETLQVVSEVMNVLLSSLGSYFLRLNDARITRGILTLCGISSSASREMLKLLSTEVSLRVHSGIPSRVPPSLKPGRWRFIGKKMAAYDVPQEAIDACRPFFLLPTDCVAALDMIEAEAHKLLTKRLSWFKTQSVEEGSSKKQKQKKAESQLRRVFKELTEGVASLRKVLKDIETMQLKGHMCLRVDVGLRPRPERFTCGFIFQAVLTPHAAVLSRQDTSSCLVLAEGGRFDALIERFKLPGAFKSTNVAAMGVRFSVDKIVSCVVDAAQAALAEGRPALTDPSRNVLVCTAGKATDTLTMRMQLAMQLWAQGINADFLHPEPLHLEDLEDYCAQQQIAWMVIVQTHAMREKKHVKVRCVRNPSEGDTIVSTNALNEFLQERFRGGGGKLNHNETGGTRHNDSMNSSSASNRDVSVSRPMLFDVSVLDGKNVSNGRDARIQSLQEHQKIVRRVSKWITTSFSARGEDTMKVFSIDLPFGLLRELSSALMEHGAAGADVTAANNPRYRKQIRSTADELLQLMPSRAGRERYVLLHSLVDDRYDMLSLSSVSTSNSSNINTRRGDRNRKSP